MKAASNDNNKIFNVYELRKDFPCLNQEINGSPLVFLDSAASAQKPQTVINELNKVYSKQYANVHRGVYYLSELSTGKFEETRSKVANFINAADEKEIVFTKGATEAINLVAASYGGKFISAGDEIIISAMEHHANIVPWQQLCKQTGAKLKIAPITDAGELDIGEYNNLLSNKTKLVAMLHMSNALGSILPIEQVIDSAHKVGAKILVDACQSVAHLEIDVQKLNADFLVFSAHKLYGPNGVGVLYGKYDLLEIMPPYQTGGEMITEVSFEETKYQLPPLKFEAGTPAIAEVIAFGSAIDYLNNIDCMAVRKHEHEMLEYATSEIPNIKGFKIIGTAKEKASVIAFVHETAHPNDIGTILDRCGVAVRTGHHCAQPLMKRLGLTATARASIGIYTTKEDIDALLEGMRKINRIFGGD